MAAWVAWDAAETLVHRFGEHDRAAPFVVRALANLDHEEDPAQRRGEEMGLRSLDLIIREAQGISPEEGSLRLARLAGLMGAEFVCPEALPAIARLIEAGCDPQPAAGLLISMWSNLAYQWRFHAAGSPETLREIERLLALLGYPVQREI